MVSCPFPSKDTAYTKGIFFKMFISKFNLKNLVNRNFIDIFLCLFHKTFYNYIEFINKIKKKTFKSKLVEFKLKLVLTLQKDHSNEFQSKKKEEKF